MVRWTVHAQAQLRHVYAYIANDSEFYAKKVSEGIVQHSLTLAELPHRGRVVPELGDSAVRELFVYSYRLIYEIKPAQIDILALVHQRQLLRAEDVSNDA